MIFPWVISTVMVFQSIHTTTADLLSITKDGHEVTRVNQLDFAIPYHDFPILDTKKYSQFLDQLDHQYSVDPINASLDQYGNIVAEKNGYRIHRHHFTEQFYRYFFSPSNRKLEIPMQPVYPKVDSELLSDIQSMRIGRYVTSFNSSNQKRSTNIQLAASAINNSVVFPNESFSFNKVVGKRTASKGYLRAPVIIRGEFSEDIGGGICQVSSTLFNAVDNAGLKIVQRFSHSRKVPYIPPGRDATVSWYGPDFEFMNSYNQPVLIRAKTMGNLLVITIFSSENIKYMPRKVPSPPY